MVPINPAIAYQPTALDVPSQLPPATAGESFSYSFSNHVTGGTGPPYIWNIVGRRSMPSGINLNSLTGQLSGVVAKSAKVKSYTVKICATGRKRPVTGSAPGNTACVTTKLNVLSAQSKTKPSPTPTSSLRVTTSELPAAISGENYQATIVTVGGQGTHLCSLRPDSSLPTGYAIDRDSCIISGRGAILSGGTTRTISPPFTITVTDSAVPPATANVTLTMVTVAASSATGTYSGNINFPDIRSGTGNAGTCGAAVVYHSITLQESQGGRIVGNFNDLVVTLTGNRVGDAITVTLQNTPGGQRGPYVWQWNGTTLTGTLPRFCVNSTITTTTPITTAVSPWLIESSYTFNLPKV